MTIDRKFSRRSLAKGLAAGGVALSGISGFLEAGDGEAMHPPAAQTAAWEQVYPGVWRGRIGKPETYTPVTTRLIPPRVEAFGRLPKVAAAPLAEIVGVVTSRGCTLQLPVRAGEQFYGFGLQFLSFQQRGKKKVARVNADPKVDTGDSHAPVPFYVSTEGIGVLVDTARYAEFYFGDARPKPTRPSGSLAQNAGSDSTTDLQPQDAGLVTVEVPRANGVDVYLFAGPSMLDAVRRYNIFSGGGPEPPEWGLGFWYRADLHVTQQGALDLIQRFRDDRIPCDVLGLEPGWQTHAYSCSFVWDKNRFPAPAEFIRSADSIGYKINLWEHAFTHPSSPLFSQLQSCSGDYGVFGGLVPDFAGREARDRFGDYHRTNFVEAGISGFKLDECDNSDYTGGWSFPELSRFPSGVDGEQMHSVFGLRYQMAVYEAFHKSRQPTWSLVRSSGALATPYPFVLYSDLYDHRQFVRALVNSGFSGLIWCPEVRDATSEEDLIRRLQTVVFSSLAMVNGWYIQSPPWIQLNRELNNAGQRMENWQQVEARCREIIQWRMRLVPYLMAAFQRYAHDGTPPFRALILDAPQEHSLREVDDQYMVGDRMMVAPLFAGEPRRRIVLPAGNWHDFWTGAAVQGGGEISVDSSTRNIPLYVKSGSIVPWADVGLHAGAPETHRITARIYGDGTLPFEMNTGAGVLQLRWNGKTGSATEGSASAHTYQLVTWKQMG